MAYVEKLLKDGAPRRPVSEMPAPAAIDWDATYNTILARGRGQISPAQSVRAVQASVEKPFAEGMLVERQIFMDLLKSDQSKGMIHSFFSERAVGNLPELKGITTRNIDHIGVIGGGTMGAGIATAALLSGLRVTLLEMTAEAGEAAHGRIAGNLVGALKRGKITAEQHDNAGSHHGLRRLGRRRSGHRGCV